MLVTVFRKYFAKNRHIKGGLLWPPSSSVLKKSLIVNVLETLSRQSREALLKTQN